MNECPREPQASLGPEAWDRVAELCWQFEQARKRDPKAEIDSFLPPADSSLRRLALLELIKIDQELHWQQGNHRLLEEYLSRFPELNDDHDAVAELLAAECTTRAAFDQPPTQEELQQRFPDLWRRINLEELLDEVRAEKAEAAPEEMETELLSNGETPVMAASQSSRAARLPQPGERFGRYKIIERIGRGGMGEVYRAVDTLLGREVAIKFPRFDRLEDRDTALRFVREARVAARIEHPNVCPIYDAGQIGGNYYIAMRLVRGRTLADLLQDEPLPVNEAVRMVARLAQAVDTVHQHGIVHRDIKPSNVMIDPSGEPLLMDFGLARPEEADLTLSTSGMLLGTIPYMSPEQVAGQPVDARSDVYALGVLLYRLITGRLPFRGPVPEVLSRILQGRFDKPSHLVPELDLCLEEICLKAMARRPSDRYQSARELAEALERYLEGKLAKTSNLARRRITRPLVAIALAGILLLAAGITIYLRTGSGTVELRIDQPGAQVTVDGKTVSLAGDHTTLQLSVGRHVVQAAKEGFQPAVEKFRIAYRGQRVRINLQLQAAVEIEVKPAGTTEDRAKPLAAQEEPPEPILWIDTPPHVGRVLLDSHGGTLFYSYEDAEHNDFPVVEFDLKQQKVVRKYVANKPAEVNVNFGLTLGPGERWLYASNYYGRVLASIDRQTGTIEFTDISSNPKYHNLWAVDVVVSSDGTKLGVICGNDSRPTDEKNDYVAILDISQGPAKLVAEVPFADEPNRAALCERANCMILTTIPRQSAQAKVVMVSFEPPYRIVRQTSLPTTFLDGVAVSDRLQRVFVGDPFHRCIYVLDSQKLEHLGKFETGVHSPAVMYMADPFNLLLVLSPVTRTALVLDARDGRILEQLNLQRREPKHLAVAGDKSLVAVGNADKQGGVGLVPLFDVLTHVLFVSDRHGGPLEIYRTSAAGGEPVRLTKDLYDDRMPRYSPDGSHIAFVSNREGKHCICLMKADGTFVRSFPETDPPAHLAFVVCIDWSPDGKKIAYCSDPSQTIRTVDVESGRIETVWHSSGAGNYTRPLAVRYLADGRIVAGICASGNTDFQDLFLLDPSTGKLTQLTNLAEQGIATTVPEPSPNGKWIAAIRSAPKQEGGRTRSIVLLDMGGKLVKEFSPPMLAPVLAWLPDSRRIAYVRRTESGGNIRILDIRTGDDYPLTTGQWLDYDVDVRWIVPAAYPEENREPSLQK